MISQPYRIYVERREPDLNMARYYAMEIGLNLFGQTCLTRSWGRIGKRGQLKQHAFEQEQEAVGLFLEIVRKKRGRGYCPPPPSNPSAGNQCTEKTVWSTDPVAPTRKAHSVGE